MKKSIVLSVSALTTLLVIQAVKADTLADWTFETTSFTGNYSPGANTTTTNYYADAGLESGTAAAFGHHVGAATYTSPAGNGSSKSFSSSAWAAGDYFEFSLNTVGYQNIALSYDQVSSSTGPGQFNLQYSTDGSTFTTFGSQYNILVNSSPNSWSAGTAISSTTFSVDLSSITALNNASTVYFRVTDATGLSASQANGGSTALATAGTDRIDNFLVIATSVPEPSTLAFAVLGGAVCLIALRRKH